MPASAKRRRKLSVDGRDFLWSYHEDDVNTLHVVSSDKRLNLRYGWQHALPPHERYVDVMGVDFQGLPAGLHGWIRVRCPEWEGSYVGSPGFVRQLIEWALQPKIEVIFKCLPEGYSTKVITASPWGPGLQTFTSSPGDQRIHRSCS